MKNCFRERKRLILNVKICSIVHQNLFVQIKKLMVEMNQTDDCNFEFYF